MDKIRLDINGTTDIVFNISNENLDMTSEQVDFNIQKNKIIDYEKGIYRNKDYFDLNLYFYNKDLKSRNTNEIIDNGKGDAHREKWEYKDDFTTEFGNSLSRLGFNFPDDLNKNAFNKSNVVLEFYSDKEGLSKWLGSEICYFNDLTSYHNEKITYVNGERYNGKDIDVIVNSVRDPSGEIRVGDTFMNEYFGYRNFDSYMNGSDSVIIYYKVLVQNAKNGNRYYMISGKDGKVDSRNYNEDYLYNELILHRNKTFEFAGILNGNLNFKELIIY